MKRRRSSLLQRTIAVLLSVVLVICMVWGAEPINALAKENEAFPESDELQMESEEGTDFEGQEETVTENSEKTVAESSEETVTEGQNGVTEQISDDGTGQEIQEMVDEDENEPETVSENNGEPEIEMELESVMMEPAPQADDIASGTEWVLDADGKLIIQSDTGMNDWLSNRDTYFSQVKSAEIQDGVKSIGVRAFQYCGNLTSITIPESVTIIERDAFNSCLILERIEIPKGVTSIGDSAFNSCVNLTDIKIPEGVTFIGEWTFKSCTSLTNITIPKKVTIIRYQAFVGCTSLEEVTMLGGTPPEVYIGAFKDCKFVTDKTQGIHVPKDKAQAYKDKWTDWADYITDAPISVLPHTHTLMKHEAVPPTCTGSGTGAYWECEGTDGCGELFSDEDGKNKIDDIPVGDAATGHDYGQWESNGNGTHTRTCQNDNTHKENGSCSGGTPTYTEKAVCDLCGGSYGECLIDTTPPEGTITIAGSSWKSFLNTITFGLFFKEMKQVTIEAEDAGSGLDKTYYYISGTQLTEADVKALGETDWTEGTSFSIDPDRKCIIYAKITDKAGNVTYISSDGLVFDGTPPAIYYVKDGETYYGAQKSVRVIDTNLESVTVNGQEVTLMHEAIFQLKAADGPQTIVATDKAGNTTTVTVTVKDKSHAHDLTLVAVKDATCMEAGNKAYYICDSDDGCGRWFSDAEGTQEITAHDSVVIPATGHSYDNSTWGYQGTDGHAYKCRKCDVHDTARTHTPGAEATATTPQICMECGYIIAPATGTDPVIGTVIPEVKLGENAPVTNISTPTDELTNMLLTEDERQQVQNGTNIRIVLEVQDAGTTVSDSDKNNIQQALNGFTVGQYLNINLYKLAGEKRTDITETEKEIRIVITIPEGLKNTDSQKTRTYAVIRVHDGKTELLTDMDSSADTIAIDTDRFSAYAIVYKDTSNDGSGGSGNSNDNGGKDNKPETGDAAPVELYATLAMIAGFSYLLLYFTNRRRGMTEETKQELVSRIVMWAKRGGKIRRMPALIAVFVLLAYYHSIGKKLCVEWKEIYED